MTRVHVHVGPLEDFRGRMVVTADSLYEIHAGLRSYLGHLGDEWRDRQYQEFAQAFLQTESALGVFAESTEIYGRYLSRLIEQLEEYLRFTPPSESSTSCALPVDGLAPGSREPNR